MTKRKIAMTYYQIFQSTRN